MSYKKDSFGGNLRPTTSTGAYNPAGLTKPGEVQNTFQWGSSTTKAVSTPEAFSGAKSSFAVAEGSGGVVPASRGYQKFRALQTQLCKDDGLLVWQKRGARDTGPYFLTLAMTAVGVAYSMSILWKMSWPKKQG